MLASKIYYVAPTPAPEVTVTGSVAGFAGTCPSVSMTVDGTVVKTNSSTTYSGKGCTVLQNGDAVSAVGARQSDGSLLATKITYTGPPAPVDVTLNGALSGLGGTCPSLSMSVAGMAVKTNSATVFNARACAELRNGDTVYAIGPKQSDGSVLASKIYYVAPAPAPEVTVTGSVAGFSGTCPSVSMTVDGTVVKTSSSTTYSGKGCTVLQNGDAVSAVGAKQSDGSLLATKITYTGPPAPVDVTLNGALSGLSGTCPALSMSVAGTAVKTNSATVFNAKTCAELKNGDTVYAIGPKQSDGSVLAGKIYYVAPAPEPASVTGAIGSLGGTCPALSMSVNGTLVKTSSATSFSGKACADLKSGDSVAVTGTKQSDGSVLATKVEGTSSTTPVYANGTVNSLSGTCPALVLNISGVAVKTNAATVFSGKACADIAIGSTLNSSNTRQSDGSLLANYVQVVK